MARHAEITEQEIIYAALALEKRGKRPNPGAVRKELGDRGGLARIKSIWEAYSDNRDDPLYESSKESLTFDSLSTNYADNAQKLFERRLKSIEASYESAFQHYKESEQTADECVQKLEEELDELQTELEGLAQQNAKLLIESAELRGQLKATKS